MLLFKCVHGEQFSLDMWNRFVSSRCGYDDVSFDEIKLWLCEVPSGNLSNDVEFDDEREKLENQGVESLHEDWSLLQQLQVNSRTYEFEKAQHWVFAITISGF